MDGDEVEERRSLRGVRCGVVVGILEGRPRWQIELDEGEARERRAMVTTRVEV